MVISQRGEKAAGRSFDSNARHILARWATAVRRLLRRSQGPGPSRGSSFFPALVESLLLALLAYVSAGLIWLLVAGPDVGVAPTRVSSAFQGGQAQSDDRSILLTFDPFAPRGQTATPKSSITEAPKTTLSLKLFGVRTGGRRGPATAIIGTPDNRQALYQVGDEIVSGVRLKEVYSSGVVLSRGGINERLTFESEDTLIRSTRVQGGSGPASGGPASGETGSSAAPALQISNGSIEQFVTSLRPKGLWRDNSFVGYAISRQVSAEPLAPFGLMPGDVFVAINGSALTADADLFGLLEALEEERSFTADVLRDDAVQTLTILLEPSR